MTAQWKKRLAAVVLTAVGVLGILGAGGSAKVQASENSTEKPIGVLVGSSADMELTRRGTDILRYDVIASAVYGLKGGMVSALAVEESMAQILSSEQEGLTYTESDLKSEAYGIIVNPEDQALKPAINSFLKTFLYSQTYEDMKARWIRSDVDHSVMPQLSNGTGEPLLVGIYPEYVPFEYIIDGGAMVGFDVELSYRLGEALGRETVIVPCSADNMFQKVRTGEVDLIISGESITAEREEAYDFSDSYYINNVVYLKNISQAAAAEKDINPFMKALHFLQDSIYRNLIRENRYLLIISGLGMTLLLVLGTALIGTIGGTGLCALREVRFLPVRKAVVFVIKILEGVPVVVLLLFVCYVVFAGSNINPILVTTVAFSANFAAHVSEVMTTGLRSVSSGQREAAASMGYHGIKLYTRIIIPQALSHVLPAYRGEFVGMVQMTAVAGYIAVQDLTKAGDVIRSRTFDAFFPLIVIAAIYLGLSWVLTLGIKRLERRLNAKNRPRVKKGF